MNRFSCCLTGAGIGAGLMYLFDPDRGRRRRKLLQDQMMHAAAKARRNSDAAWRDLYHRTYGTAAQFRSAVGHDEVSDEVLVARVRSKMGRYVSHPSAIEVTANNGHVTLTGPVLAHEVHDLIAAVRSVRGVRDVENLLEAHRTSENVPALQGGVRRPGEPYDLMQNNWSPATRLVAGATGCTLVGRCLRRPTPTAMLLGTVGFALSARAFANIEMRRLFGLTEGRRGIDIQKTIVVHAPVEQVYEFLMEPLNYPRFTEVFRSVRELGDGRYRKTVAGPAGAELTVEETIFRSVPNKLASWRSEPNSAIKYSGTARFVPLDDSTTQVQVHATYNPPGGIVSHAAARFAGLDPKSLMDDVLMRAKSFLETGQQPHDAADQTPLEVPRTESSV